MANIHSDDDDNVFWWDSELSLATVAVHSSTLQSDDDNGLSSVDALRQQMESWEVLLAEKITPLLHSAVNEIQASGQGLSTSTPTTSCPAVLSFIQLFTGEGSGSNAPAAERIARRNAQGTEKTESALLFSSWLTEFFRQHIPVLADVVKAAVEESSPSPASMSEDTGKTSPGSSPQCVQSSPMLQRLCLTISLECFNRVLDKEFSQAIQPHTTRRDDMDGMRRYLSQIVVDGLLLNLLAYYLSLDEKALIGREPAFSPSVLEGDEEHVEMDPISNFAFTVVDEEDACHHRLYLQARLLGRQMASLSQYLDQIRQEEREQQRREENDKEEQKGNEERQDTATTSTAGSSDSTSSHWMMRTPSMVESFLQNLPVIWNELTTKGATHHESAVDENGLFSLVCAAAPLIRHMARSAVSHFLDVFVQGYRKAGESCEEQGYPNAAAVLRALRSGMLKRPNSTLKMDPSLSSSPSPSSIAISKTPSLSLQDHLEKNWSSLETIQLLAQCYDPLCISPLHLNQSNQEDSVVTALRWLMCVRRFLKSTLSTAAYKESAPGTEELSSSHRRRQNNVLNSKYLSLRDASLAFSEVLTSPHVHPSVCILLLPYYIMLSNLFYVERKYGEQQRILNEEKTSKSLNPSSFALSSRFMDILLSGSFHSNSNSILFQRCFGEAEEMVKERLKQVCANTTSSPVTSPNISNDPYSSGRPFSLNHLPLGLAFLLQPEIVLKLVTLAQQSPLASELPSLEDEIRSSNKASPVITDQRFQSQQRDEAYRSMSSLLQLKTGLLVLPPGNVKANGSDSASDVLLSKVDLAARVFHPRYYAIFSALSEGVNHLVLWIAGHPQFLLFAQLMGFSQTELADIAFSSSVSLTPPVVVDDEESTRKYRANFTKMVSLYINCLMEKIVGRVVRPFLRASDDPAVSLVQTEFWMFCTLVTSDVLGSATKGKPAGPTAVVMEEASLPGKVHSRLGFLFPTLQQFFSWRDVGSPSSSSSSKWVHHFLYLIHRRIVHEKGYAFASFFIPSLRAAGVDDSMVDEVADLMRIARIPYRKYHSNGSTPLPADAPLNLPRIGAELILVRELPRAGYCSSGAPPLSESLKDDAVLWWDRMLFSAFDSDEMVDLAISQLEPFMKAEGADGLAQGDSPRGPTDRSVGSNSGEETQDSRDSATKRPRGEEEHVASEEGLPAKSVKLEAVIRSPQLERSETQCEEKQSIRTSIAFTAQRMLEIIVEVGTLVTHRILSMQRGPSAASETMPFKPGRAPMVLEADVLKAFFVGWWRLCDEMCYSSQLFEKTGDPSLSPSEQKDKLMKSESRLLSLFQRRQRTKYVVMRAIASRFGISHIPSFSLSDPHWSTDVSVSQFFAFILMHLETTTKVLDGSSNAPPSRGWTMLLTPCEDPAATSSGDRLRQWMATLEYEDVEYEEAEKMICPGVPPSRGGGPRGILRQCNFDYGKVLDTAILQRRHLFMFYLEWKKKHKAFYLASLRQSLEADGKTITPQATPSSADSQQQETVASPTPSRSQSSNAYLTDIIRFIRMRSTISPGEAAGAAAGFRQLILYATGVITIPPPPPPAAAAASQNSGLVSSSSCELPPHCLSWLTPFIAIDFCSKLVYAICRQLKMESASLSSSSATRAASPIPMTLGELTGMAISLRIFWDTLVEVHRHLETKQGGETTSFSSSSSSSSIAAKENPLLLKNVLAAKRHLLEDLTSAMKHMILANRTKTDAAVLLLAEHFTSALANLTDYLAVVEQAKKRLNSLRGGHHALALRKLIDLPIPLPETRSSVSSSGPQSAESSASSERKRRRGGGKSRSDRRGDEEENGHHHHPKDAEDEKRRGESHRDGGGDERDRRERDRDARRRDRHRRRRSGSRDRDHSGAGGSTSGGGGGGEDSHRREGDSGRNAASGEGRMKISFVEDIGHDHEHRPSTRGGKRRSSHRHGHGSRNRNRR